MNLPVDYVSILGTPYTIEESNKDNNPKLEDSMGICEPYSKHIVIDDFVESSKDTMQCDNIEECQKKVVRHEVIHAFLVESGLMECSPWADNEEMVDFFALQFPKIADVFRQLKVMQKG